MSQAKPHGAGPAPSGSRRIALALGCAVWLCAGVAAGSEPAASPAPDLFALVDARLELMDEVAAYKWHNGLPIEDPAREAVVLAAAQQDGLRSAVTLTSSRRLFEAQIVAAKAIQAYWFERWASGTAPPAPPDLSGTIRPQLLRLGNDIVAAAAKGTDPASRPQFERTVAVTGLSPAVRASLFAALLGVSRYANVLDQILDSGTLRVGTTGDYAPFSLRQDDEPQPVGIDIDLARNLAAGLGVTAQFVPTSWTELLNDLETGAFDIAMSGVSRTLERQRRAFLSAPYYVGGKTPIARCGDAGAFASLAEIDRPGVRVIVNPGGTNERFVEENIRQATQILHDDNRTIFDAILQGRADVMITDRVEVALQSTQRPGLCATMDETLSYQEKAYLLPRDAVWRAFVETWLSLALADGTVAGAFRRHGVEPNPPRT